MMSANQPISIESHFLFVGLIRGVNRQYSVAITVSRVTGGGKRREMVFFAFLPCHGLSFDVAIAVLAVRRESVCNQYEKKTKSAMIKQIRFIIDRIYALLAMQT